MKNQLIDLGCSFDWNRELSTCNPLYYRWTQFIFLKLHESGLAYQKEAPVHWDPVDQTVLADEQIDDQGKSWRSGAVVERRMLKQWYLRTTAYSKQLIDGLQEVNSDLWRDIINLQAHWIGTCDGMRFNFQLQLNGSELNPPLSVFTKVPEAIYGVSHLYIAKDHYLNNEKYYKNASRVEDSIELEVVAVHPFTGRQLPVFVTPSRDFGEHLDSAFGIPSCNTDDAQFAARHNLVHINVHRNGYLVNSDFLNGMSPKEAFNTIASRAKEMRCGYVTSEKARDWLISRQRYWGTPIPIVHCPKYGAVPVPLEDLPVTLPQLEQYRGHGVSPLASAKEWMKAKCAKCDCGGYGTRETDTMDTFVDSSWYFLRYLDSKNSNELISAKASKLMPVDLYIGGKEHAIMHLYYARFISHFLHSLGMVPCREPFVNLLTQGMVMGRSYRLTNTGRYLQASELDFTGKVPVQAGTGAAVTVDWEKMSKSKYNGVNPEDVLQEYGTDTTRLCILANVAPKSDRPWSSEVFVGVLRWQNRVWSLVTDFILRNNSDVAECGVTHDSQKQHIEEQLFSMRNLTLKEVTFHMEKTFLLNSAISRLQSLTNVLKKVPKAAIGSSVQFEKSLAELVIMISPFAPMFASELWNGMASASRKKTGDLFRWSNDVLDQNWPSLDKNYALSMSVVVNGRDEFDIQLPMPYEETSTLTCEDALSLARQHVNYATVVGNSSLLKQHLSFDKPALRVELQLSVASGKKKKYKRD